MRFLSYSHSLAPRPKISVDGLVPNSFNVTHWPGNNTPKEFKADITTEIALNIVKSGRYDEVLAKYDIVTNNHFDADGVIPAWVLMHPEEALDHKDILIATARCGDFDWVESVEALKFNMTLEQFAGSPISPLREKLRRASDSDQLLYDHFLERLPDIAYDADRYSFLWERRLRKFHELMDARGSIAEVRERPEIHFATIVSPRRLPDLEQANLTRMDRLLFARPGRDGTLFDFRYSPYSWYDIVSRRYGRRIPLHGVARELNRIEPSRGGKWRVRRNWSESEGLYFGERGGWSPRKALSGLMVEEVEDVLVDEFRAAARRGAG